MITLNPAPGAINAHPNDNLTYHHFRTLHFRASASKLPNSKNLTAVALLYVPQISCVASRTSLEIKMQKRIFVGTSRADCHFEKG